MCCIYHTTVSRSIKICRFGQKNYFYFLNVKIYYFGNAEKCLRLMRKTVGILVKPEEGTYHLIILTLFIYYQNLESGFRSVSSKNDFRTFGYFSSVHQWVFLFYCPLETFVANHFLLKEELHRS